MVMPFLNNNDIKIVYTSKLKYEKPQVIKFTSCLPMVGGSLRILRLLPPLKLVAMILLKYC
jgi:hypothetical protein